MKRVSRALIVTALCVLFHGAVSAFGGGSAAQRRIRRPPVRPRASVTPAIDYSKFLHSTKKHQGACVTCHKIPTSNWQKVREYPDVADYPDHDACVSCHRPQFFRGAKPPICSVCHTKVSPRDDERFAFRNPVGRRQFLIEFPHDKHQDVIAKLFRRFTEPRANFVRASFSFQTQDQTKRYNNCEICHGPRPKPLVAPASGWVDGFVPDSLTLKSVPDNHSSCFSCHWKSEQPVNENCGGCHKLPNPPAMIAVMDLPNRKSMKFRHGVEHHTMECTTCHINITKASTLRGLKPDVPIAPSCSSCHNKAPTHLEISNELVAIDKNRDFVCVYCHTSDVGRRDPPASHYLSAERPPIKRKDVK